MAVDDDHYTYFLQRAREEREAASRVPSPLAATQHLTKADCYDRLASQIRFSR